jgi:hypothetical protein
VTLMSTNVRFLKGICVVVPAATMAAAHWFPWRRVFHRELHRLEAYACGTTAIVGTAALTIAHSEGDRGDHSTMLLVAAASAGATTLLAYALDKFVQQRARLARLLAEQDVLNGNL